MSNDELRNLPYEVAQCENLKKINLLGNPDLCWKNTFDTLLKLPHLEEISLEITCFDSIPKELYPKITDLELRDTLLTSFDKIGEFKNLTRLYLTRSKLKILPKEIGELKKIKRLTLYGNTLLSCLPPEIGQLKNLTSFRLNWSQVKELPLEFYNLSNLTVLDLYHNQLTSLLPQIGKLKKLTSLNLRYCKLSSLPKEIGHLTKLTSLELASNQLTSLPKEIGRLTNLTSLELTGNQLTSLPKEIGNLKKVKYISLEHNQLKTLPKEIGKLDSLHTLCVLCNPLEDLPSEIFNLKIVYPDFLSDWAFKLLEKHRNKEAVLFAEKSIEKNDKNVKNFSCLAISYLFNNQYDKAKEIVLKWKNKKGEYEEDFNFALKQAILELESVKITHPDIPKILKLLEV